MLCPFWSDWAAICILPLPDLRFCEDGVQSCAEQRFVGRKIAITVRRDETA
jgi:hypothetical protein